jgi:hypothetical protein
MADIRDLKTQQFAQVLSAVPVGVPVVIRCQRLLDSVAQSAALRALLVGLGALFVLLLVRPPFMLSFEYDKTRPWKGRSHVSWLSVMAVVTLAAAAAAAVPWAC